MIKTYERVKGKTALELLSDDEKKKYYCVSLNGHIRDLNYKMQSDEKLTLEYLDITNQETSRIYEASFRFLLIMALKSINSDYDARFFYNISRGTFVRIYYRGKEMKVTPDFVDNLKPVIEDIVSANILFERHKISIDDAISKYKEEKLADKLSLLKYRKEDFVHYYVATYKKLTYMDYLYTPLVPSSSYLKNYQLNYLAPGFIVQLPRPELKGKIPSFVSEPKFENMLISSSRWAEKVKLDTVYNINKFIKEYSPLGLINISETRINDMLAKLGDEIENRKTVKLICIAGPSSSGKTSFANRLTYELMSRGINAIRLSLDNFYFPRKNLPKNINVDSLEAFDIELLNKTLLDLMQGSSVDLPKFDFTTKDRTTLGKAKISSDQVIILEGIHALNEKMTYLVSTSEKFLIYISPQPQINVDYHTPIPITDIRLLRRISRDSRTRNTNASSTLSYWHVVRDSEFKYIYPTQENADFIFDSFIHYELCAIRNIVLPQLEKITLDDPSYLTAQRLIHTVKYFVPISSEDIPCNSLIREFIGGTSFKDAV